MQPTEADILAAHQLSAAWGHILDAQAWDRLDECLKDDAIYDGSVFGLEAAVGLDAIRSALSSGRHALAHHATNVLVLEGPEDELKMMSKGLGVLEGGGVSSVTYIDRLVHGPSGWRIAERVVQLRRASS